VVHVVVGCSLRFDEEMFQSRWKPPCLANGGTQDGEPPSETVALCTERRCVCAGRAAPRAQAADHCSLAGLHGGARWGSSCACRCCLRRG